MELHRLPADAALRPGPVDASWAAAVHRGPRTIAEILADASITMDEQDDAELQAADPVTWLRAHRNKRSLWARLTGRR